ncbi:amidohydrolase family protein [Thermus thermamylovorans]|uniref:Amidohydrolase n=1 Tax=Thermus thermamylovorans TaxID=2509362 RepID=A0A4Q9B5U2_9DEIN|nr:amidohydrolase family protein [Thermus thermamylovorans]TBH20996.1 amidohydrolase [Thermus thermamylovorans]
MFWLKTELWTAEVVYTGFGTPMLRGAIAVQGRHVVGQGSLEELKGRFPEAEVVPKGKALFPPPVNAHTHLDLSLHPLYRGPFSGFIPHVVAHRERRGLEAAQKGLEELLASGAGAFADVVFKDEVMEFLLRESPLPGVAFYEVFAPDPEDAEEVFQQVQAKIRAWRRLEGRVRVGLSPHAPYSVSAPLLRRLAQYARAEGLPLMVHAGESLEEVAFLLRREGPLAEVHRRFSQTPWAPPGLTPIRHLHALGVLGPHTALVHGVQVDEEEVRLLAETGTKVILCPRSNAGLGVGEAPLALYARHGVELALGTDSLASSPDLDVKNEVLFLWERADPRLLVRALTRGGYRALGLPSPRLARGTPSALVHSL